MKITIRRFYVHVEDAKDGYTRWISQDYDDEDVGGVTNNNMGLDEETTDNGSEEEGVGHDGGEEVGYDWDEANTP